MIHHPLQAQLLSKESILIPDIDKFGPLPRLSKLFDDIGVTMIYSSQRSGYQGFELQINNMKEVKKLTMNYYLAWMMGIIHRYPVGMNYYLAWMMGIIHRYPVGMSPCNNCVVHDKNAGIN